jgi:hypothetical protein
MRKALVIFSFHYHGIKEIESEAAIKISQKVS